MPSAPATRYEAEQELRELEKREQDERDRMPCATCLHAVMRLLDDRQPRDKTGNPERQWMFRDSYEEAIKAMANRIGWPRTIRHWCRGVADRHPPASKEAAKMNHEGVTIATVGHWPCLEHQPAEGRW